MRIEIIILPRSSLSSESLNRETNCSAREIHAKLGSVVAVEFFLKFPFTEG